MTHRLRPQDAGALSVGADEVAHAIAAEAKARGVAPDASSATARAALFWLEPLVEVDTPAGRIAYGPVSVGGRARAVRRRISSTAAHTRCALGPTEEIPWFKGQQRLTFARVGIVDPTSVDGLRAPRRLRRA